MKFRFNCLHCGTANSQAISAPDEDLRCSTCAWSRRVTADEFDGERPTRCLICGNGDLWRQKDFPQSAGLALVAAGALLSSIAWYDHHPVLALGILLSFAAADLLLFALMPDVLVCYRCGARHSGGDLGEHAHFNHETAECYRQKRLRLEAGRRGEEMTSSAAPSSGFGSPLAGERK